MAPHPTILVSGAAGKTGLAVIRALAASGAKVNALTRRAEQTQCVSEAGAAHVISGDLADAHLVSKAMEGADAVYLILPNVHPNETALGLIAIKAAKNNGVRSFVYHSVLFPQIEAMPHHWQKLRVEEALVQSGLAFTILQPASYMQNIGPHWEEIKATGLYRVPYSIDADFSLLDLGDVAAAASHCLLEPGHTGATYQLAGPERLTPKEMAREMGHYLGRAVNAIQQPLDEWSESAKAAKLTSYAIETLTKMFLYYDQHGFSGSAQTLEYLLGRRATTFGEYLETLAG
ncbi:MAG: NmrA family NAD(P)-binding protein [Anaerolineales bacterium]